MSGVLTAFSLDEAADALRAGQPVVLPTDTVYGLAVSVVDCGSPEVLYQIKGRPAEKAIPWLVSTIEDLERYTCDLPEWAWQLARSHWPGALTLVCQASDDVPAAWRADDGSLALRMPDHPLALELMELLGNPLACTSANLSGQPPVSLVSELAGEVLSTVAGVLVDPDETAGREPVPSTIVSCLGPRPGVLRQGALDLTEELAVL